MAIITKIEAQKKNTDRVNIYINDDFLNLKFYIYTRKDLYKWKTISYKRT